MEQIAARIGVVFFGIERALEYTKESINQVIYSVKTSGAQVRIIASLNLITDLHNPRTGERNNNINLSNIFQLNADHYILSKQCNNKIEELLRFAQCQNDPHRDGWKSVQNYLHQLNSLQRAWNFISQNLEKSDFQYFLFLRPDLKYIDKIPISALMEAFLSEESRPNIAVPAWHSYGGLNDRFAFADKKAASIYSQRLSAVQRFCKSYPLHSETFLKDVLLREGCKIWELPMRAQRVRIGGREIPEDFDISRIILPKIPCLDTYEG